MGGYGPSAEMMGGYGRGWTHGRGANAEFGPENCPRFQGGLAGLGSYGQQGNLNLSTDEVKKRFEGWLTWQGNPHLKVGEVKEKDADTIERNVPQARRGPVDGGRRAAAPERSGRRKNHTTATIRRTRNMSHKNMPNGPNKLPPPQPIMSQ